MQLKFIHIMDIHAFYFLKKIQSQVYMLSC